MNCKQKLKMFGILHVLVFTVSLVFAENIDPHEDSSQYAYGENVDWLNFEPNIPADPCDYEVTVSDTGLTGFVWAENIGWINLDPDSNEPNVGIKNDGTGKLSGYAWAENIGWIKFNPIVAGDPNDYGVKIDTDGNFSGFAWGENIGWINFSINNYYVVACKVTFEDLANFVDDWLDTGNVPGNLDSTGNADFTDYSIFADYWLCYCPEGWPLK